MGMPKTYTLNLTMRATSQVTADGVRFTRKEVRRAPGDPSLVSVQHYVNDQPVSRADYNDALTTAELNEINRNAAINVGPN